MPYSRYYERPRRTLLGSYCQGLDLLGMTARSDLSRYRRRDGLAILDAWRTTGEAIDRAMKRYAAEEAVRARTSEATPAAIR
jgi:hypothetical protein